MGASIKEVMKVHDSISFTKDTNIVVDPPSIVAIETIKGTKPPLYDTKSSPNLEILENEAFVTIAFEDDVEGAHTQTIEKKTTAKKEVNDDNDEHILVPLLPP
ncbi:hypothetical protein Fmac_014856 [Flemingia macrophylla]|uniref:Uncharacterized protein n=1 Tax=Flemingia macrophylla TaxID=520843 RepID=A0ABD1MCY3_9FABA